MIKSKTSASKSTENKNHASPTAASAAIHGSETSNAMDVSMELTLASRRANAEQTSPEIKQSKPKATKPKSGRKRKRRRTSSSTSSYEDGIDTQIEEKLKQSALRNNLTHKNVRNILQKVVQNDHVLAIVKLKEEELERHEQARKLTKIGHSVENYANKDYDDDYENEDADDLSKTLPKLTRAKAKALNQYPLPLAPFKHSEPNSEVVALIREELQSDDDDEEYQPGDDDIESDDDINTTVSDVDSQPRTPQTSLGHTDADDDGCGQQPTYTKDGLFKIPKARNDSATSQSMEQEYIIAQRTRSKVSLAETPIEAIESTFRAPDVPLDMYDHNLDWEVDGDYMQFLTDLYHHQTLSKPDECVEKDEEADPDYVAADKHPVDREELRHVKVSEKEHNDLLNDLSECLMGVDFLDGNNIIGECFSTTASSVEPSESLITPIKNTGDPSTSQDICAIHSTQQQPIIKANNKTLENAKGINSQSSIAQSMNDLTSTISYFDPNITAKPARPSKSIENRLRTPERSMLNYSITQQSSNSSTDRANPTYSPSNDVQASVAPQYTAPYPYPVNPIAFTRVPDTSPPMLIPLITLNPTSSTQLVPNNVLPYSSISITVPPAIATPSTPTHNSEPVHVTAALQNVTQQPISNSNSLTCLNKQLEGGPIRRSNRRAKRSRFKSAKFEELENLDPNAIESLTDAFPPQMKGFTVQQRLILNQQLRFHVQFAAQNFIQTYGHPEFYPKASTFKRFLLELEEIDDKNKNKLNRIPIANLKPAINLLREWEAELSVPSKENTELVEFIRNEISKLRRNLCYTMKFHERILQKICQSKVFIYPKLLPTIPFRIDTAKKSEYIPAEDYFIAFNLERIFDELRQQMQRYSFAKPKNVTLIDVCRHIVSRMGHLRQYKSIYDYVRLKKSRQHPNPIQFYFKHKRAPPFRHQLEPFDEYNIVEPAKQPLTALSLQWAHYVNKLIGLEREKVLKNFVVPVDGDESFVQNTAKTTVTNKPEAIPSSSIIGIDKASLLRLPKLESNANEPTIRIEVIFKTTSSSDQNECSFHPNTDNITTRGKSSDVTTEDQRTPRRQHCKGQTLMTSYFSVLPKFRNDPPTNPGLIQICKSTAVIEIENDNGNATTLAVRNSKTIDLTLNRCYKRIRRKYLRFEKRKYSNRVRSRKQIGRIVQKIKERQTKRWCRYERNEYLLFVYLCLRTYHRYTSIFMKMHHNLTTSTAATGKRVASNVASRVKPTQHNSSNNKSVPIDIVLINKRLQKITSYSNHSDQTIDEANGGDVNNPTTNTISSISVPSTSLAENSTSSTTSTPVSASVSSDVHSSTLNSVNNTNDTATKRLPKSQRAVDNVRLMLLYENQQESSEKDYLFAQHFFDRVEETYITENNHQKFAEFCSILRCFDERTQTVADLYYRLEKLFVPDHPELADIFLNFLTPSDAIVIGKFMEHFFIANMSKFINKLNIFYQKQPAQIRKILACIREMADEEDLKIEKIRSKVLPLLKGNQLLIDWFLQCIRNGQTTGGDTKQQDDYETLIFRKVNETIDDDAETFEYIPQSEILPDPNENPCHIRYMNGRIFYGNRLSVPAKLSFSMNGTADGIDSSNRLSLQNGEKNTTSGSKRALYRCVHDINHFGDIKIRDITKNPTESDMAGSTNTTTTTAVTEDSEVSEDENMSAAQKNDDKQHGDRGSSEHLVAEQTPSAPNDVALCDDVMLKAHGVRLNPAAHSSVSYSNTEMLNMLKQSYKNPADMCADGDLKEPLRLSPKKQPTSKCTPPAQSKQQRKSSPNIKKSAIACSRSPNTKKTLSPCTLSSSSATNIASDTTNRIPVDSQAIQTAKKLKRILNESSSAPFTNYTNPTVDESSVKSESSNSTKRTNASTVSSNKVRKLSRTNSPASSIPSKPPIKQPKRTAGERNSLAVMKDEPSRSEECDDSSKIMMDRAQYLTNEVKNEAEVEREKDGETDEKSQAIIWSRDEDRLLLEQIKNGLNSDSERVSEIANQFPTKTHDHVQERIDFLIDFLTKLRNMI